MFARGNCGLSGESMTASLMHLLVLVHLRILNWIVVNSPRLWIIPDLRRGIDGDSQISQNRMWYDEIECNRNKDTGNGFNSQSEPFHSEFFNSEWIKSPQVGFEPTTSQLTADRSTTELLRNNRRLDLIKFNSRSQPMTNMSSKFPF